MNDDLKVDIISDKLKDKKIAFCVSGGIAAIEVPKIIRQLRRHQAHIQCYTTDNVYKFIGETSLEWATDRKVVSTLSGLSEHICNEDIIILAPATMNTYNKICLGIADNVITTLIASAIGMNKKIFIALTMHISLYKNKLFQKNLKVADKLNLEIIKPRFSENKVKMPHLNDFIEQILGSKNV